MVTSVTIIVLPKLRNVSFCSRFALDFSFNSYSWTQSSTLFLQYSLSELPGKTIQWILHYFDFFWDVDLKGICVNSPSSIYETNNICKSSARSERCDSYLGKPYCRHDIYSGVVTFRWNIDRSCTGVKISFDLYFIIFHMVPSKYCYVTTISLNEHSLNIYKISRYKPDITIDKRKTVVSIWLIYVDNFFCNDEV